jgi:hypothetical protein
MMHCLRVPARPGGEILLKAGSVWKGQQLGPKRSERSGNLIVVDTYDTGPVPKWSGPCLRERSRVADDAADYEKGGTR